MFVWNYSIFRSVSFASTRVVKKMNSSFLFIFPACDEAHPSATLTNGESQRRITNGTIRRLAKPKTTSMAQSVHIAVSSSSASTGKRLPLSRSSHQLRLATPPVTTSVTNNRRVMGDLFENQSFTSHSSMLQLALRQFQHPQANLVHHQPKNLHQPNNRPTVQNFHRHPRNHRLFRLVQNLLLNHLE